MVPKGKQILLSFHDALRLVFSVLLPDQEVGNLVANPGARDSRTVGLGERGGSRVHTHPAPTTHTRSRTTDGHTLSAQPQSRATRSAHRTHITPHAQTHGTSHTSATHADTPPTRSHPHSPLTAARTRGSRRTARGGAGAGAGAQPGAAGRGRGAGFAAGA